jgi:membrane protein YqaA with SNARE-associated domain
MIVPLTAAATLGQMSAKCLLYLAGRGVLRLPLERHETRLAAVRQRLERHVGRTGALMFVSAFSGFPPFYLVSIVAGTLRVRFGAFFAAGLGGRCLRFAVCVIVPQAVRAVA